MSKYVNNKAKGFLDSIPRASIENSNDNLASRCKFNFSYFCNQAAGQDFTDWTQEQNIKLLNKLVEFSRDSLTYWEAQNKLVIYGGFPKKTDFNHPKHVPHQAMWARFRLEGAVRLIGFVIPKEYADKEQRSNSFKFCTNTFYVVFLDKNHLFYKTKK